MVGYKSMTVELKRGPQIEEGEELIAFLSYIATYNIELVREGHLGEAILGLAGKYLKR